MGRAAHIVWMTTGVTIVIVLLVGAVIWGVKDTPASAPCTAIEYIISDSIDRMYLSEQELDRLLREHDLYPVGRSLDTLVLHRIESVVCHHPMVRKAECYLTPRNEVYIRLTQRVPLLRVQLPGENYFIDSDRRVMEVRNSIKDNVLMVSGAVGLQTAATTLADFAEWLQDNRYWREHIQRIYMQTPNNMVLIMKGNSQPRIIVGTIGGYETKLSKLYTFMENGTEVAGDTQYKEIDLRFSGQVIGRK